jgi:hypothetical protein
VFRTKTKETRCTNIFLRTSVVGRDSSVGIATRYGLDGPEIDFQWGRDFRTRPCRPWGPPSLLYKGYQVSLPGVKRTWGGVDHLHSPSGTSRHVLQWTLPVIFQSIQSIYTIYVGTFFYIINLLHIKHTMVVCVSSINPMAIGCFICVNINLVKVLIDINSFVTSGGILYKILVLGINEIVSIPFIWSFKRLFLIFDLQDQYFY